MSEQKYLNLNNGLRMPIIGYGTWMASEEEINTAVNEALKVGYRHIDTAPVYLNEKAIGNVLTKWFSSGKIKRSDLFITTKLPPPGADRPDLVELTLRKSLADLQLDYVDLYLIHTPITVVVDEKGAFKHYEDGTIIVDPSTDLVAIWKEMEGLVAKGLTKSIGISNFTIKQIDRILQNCTIKPAVLQIEYHIYLQQPELIEFCKSANIAVTAYSPLGSKGVGTLNKRAGVERELPDLLEVPVVKEIAQNHSKSEAQVLLRWIVQKGISVIPKSTNPKRMYENKNIFDFKLRAEEMEQLNSLDANIRVVNFSFFPGVEKHPEFPF
ncbi:aldo-keto reductase family 1 member A1 [Bactrocera neohumeralis]|uniref:aldo-keto reductase family 1 member A1 n=1 Tax=Bactrocera tryoni TaxID=59916 RepID=UPI001A97BD7F|nr:aldo-keto reductase family 1 member A1 [Bactrocera tryoni]XP_050316814.1 aldo-keto reductase family 1 member A1 [Bactrocera neohumeralis]